MVAVVCAGLLCGGCAHRCVVADRAAVAANVACAAAGMETSDPALLVRCELATREIRRAIRGGVCGQHVEERER